MLKLGTYKYIVDCVNSENHASFTKALAFVPTMTGFAFDRSSRILAVEAARNPEDSIRLACEFVGAHLRARVK